MPPLRGNNLEGHTVSRKARGNALAAFFSLLLALTSLVGTARAQVPVVFKVSEGVRPNALLSLYGEYLTGTPTVRFLRADGTVAATQTSVQTDRGGHFCRVEFPLIPPGAYRLAVNNGAGWSTLRTDVNRATRAGSPRSGPTRACR